MATSTDKGPNLPMKIVIIVFAVILVVSLCLPFFSSCSNAATSGSGDDASSSTSDAKTMAQVDEDNQAIVDSINAKIAANSSGSAQLAGLANLGNAYMNWGGELQQASDYVPASASAASSSADASKGSDASGATDSDATQADEHVKDVFSQAVSYYDRYLELNESNAVRVNRAVSLYYAGDEDGAIASLEELTGESGDFSPAWFQLAMFYQTDGETSAARSAFERAISADAVESYGVSSYAQIYLAMLSAYESAGSASSAGDAAYSSRALESDLSASLATDGTVGGGLPEASLSLDAPRLSALADAASSSGDAAASSAGEAA